MLVAACVVGALLVIAAVFSVARALRDSGLEDGDNPATLRAVDGDMASSNDFLPPEEIDRQHAAYKPPVPIIPVLAAVPAAVTPANQTNDEVILQRAKGKVNQRIIERMQQYIRDNPNLDTRELEKQIKKRENQGAQIP